MDLLKTFWINLEKWQRITLIVVLQGIFILMIGTTLSWAINNNREHVVVIDDSDQSADMPRVAKEAYMDALWQIIKDNVKDADRNIIRDVQIRDGSYTEEEVNNDGVIQAGFIVDIDSIQQTYRVTISWDKNDASVMDAIIDCPTPDENRFPDSFCQGTYRNTNDLSLYLPHMSYPEGRDGSSPSAPNYMITGDQDSKFLNIMVSICDAEKFKKEAWDYLNTVPIDFSDYTVKYEENGINVRC